MPVKRLYFSHIMVKKRRRTVRADKSIQVQMTPVAMLTDANISNRCLGRRRFFDRYGQRLHTFGSGYVATIAIALLHKVFCRLQKNTLAMQQLREVLDRWQVSRREDDRIGRREEIHTLCHSPIQFAFMTTPTILSSGTIPRWRESGPLAGLSARIQ